MASDSLERQPPTNRLGWEWAPPPSPKPSALRQQEPLWQEPYVPPPQSGMDLRTKAILFLSGGGFFLLCAFSAAGWLIVAVPLLAIGGKMLADNASDQTRPAVVAKSREDKWAEYQQVHKSWSEAIEREEAEAHRKYSGAPRWYPIERPDPNRRLDVYGGQVEGWASFLNTAFAPILAQGIPLTIVDLTRRDLARRALWDADPTLPEPIVARLPSQLFQFDPLFGSSDPGDIAAFLTSAQSANDTGARRDIEVAIFRRVGDVLGQTPTLPRMLAAVTCLFSPNASLVSEQLTDEERDTLLAPDFTVMFGPEYSSHLSRIAASLEAVIRRARASEPGGESVQVRPLPFFEPERASVVIAESDSDVESRRRVDNVLVASLADRLGRPQPRGTFVIVIGCDRLERHALEELTSRCQERGMRLVLIFEHLRGEARELLGRGAVDTLIMGLGNHDDASAAANFIGKQHRFKVSTISLTVGTQIGGADTHGMNVDRSSSFTDQSMGGDSTTTGHSVGTNFSYSTNWSETKNYGETSTLSEDFVARIEDVQRIPTTGFVYVSVSKGRQHVIFGDCHPAIAHTPLVATKAIARA